jgi:hypothetical protein
MGRCRSTTYFEIQYKLMTAIDIHSVQSFLHLVLVSTKGFFDERKWFMRGTISWLCQETQKNLVRPPTIGLSL